MENMNDGAEEFRLHSDFLQFPRWAIDDLMPVNGLPAPFFRVLLFTLRKTLGWGKREDYIPLSQIERGACVGRRDACNALRFWTEVGIIEVLPDGKRGMNKIRITGRVSVTEAKRRIVNWIAARRTSSLR